MVLCEAWERAMTGRMRTWVATGFFSLCGLWLVWYTNSRPAFEIIDADGIYYRFDEARLNTVVGKRKGMESPINGPAKLRSIHRFVVDVWFPDPNLERTSNALERTTPDCSFLQGEWAHLVGHEKGVYHIELRERQLFGIYPENAKYWFNIKVGSSRTRPKSQP